MPSLKHVSSDHFIAKRESKSFSVKAGPIPFTDRVGVAIMRSVVKNILSGVVLICFSTGLAAPFAHSDRTNFELVSPTGRVVSQDRLSSRLRSLSRKELSASLHELTDCHLHGPNAIIDLCTGLNDTNILPPMSPEDVKIDGVALPADTDLTVSLTTHHVNAHRIVVVRNAHREPIIIWWNGVPLHPLNSKDYPGLFVRYNRNKSNSLQSFDGRLVSLDDDAIPIPTTLDARHGNDSEPKALSAVESCQKGASPRQVEMAIAFDAEYCKMFSVNGEQAIQSIRALVAEAEKAFSDDTCVRLKAISIDGVCNAEKDPYVKIGSDPLEMFRQYWISNMGSVKRDIAYFVSGAEDGTSTAGRAYLRATCNEVYGYGWTEGNSPAILAHEMGHTLGADHAESGLMKPSLSGNDPLKFSSTTLQQIISFVDNGGAGSDCLTAAKGGAAPKTSPSNIPSRSPVPSHSSSQSPTSSASSPPSSSPSSSSSPIPSASTSITPSRSTSPIPSRRPRVPSASPEVVMSQSPSESSKPSRPPVMSDKPERTPKTSPVVPKPSRAVHPSPETSRSPSESLPSFVPSESPEPSLFEASSPAPPEDTSDKPDTCQFSLDRMGRALPCTYWENLGSLGSRLGVIKIYMRQFNGRFQLYLKPEVDSHMGGDVEIVSVNVVFSFMFNGGNSDASVKRSLRGKHPYSLISVQPRFLKMPMGTYCCDAVLYIDIDITISRKMLFGGWKYEGFSDASGVYASQVMCKPDCEDRSGLGVGENCPVCA